MRAHELTKRTIKSTFLQTPPKSSLFCRFLLECVRLWLRRGTRSPRERSPAVMYRSRSAAMHSPASASPSACPLPPLLFCRRTVTHISAAVARRRGRRRRKERLANGSRGRVPRTSTGGCSVRSTAADWDFTSIEGCSQRRMVSGEGSRPATETPKARSQPMERSSPFDRSIKDGDGRVLVRTNPKLGGWARMSRKTNTYSTQHQTTA